MTGQTLFEDLEQELRTIEQAASVPDTAPLPRGWATPSKGWSRDEWVALSQEERDAIRANNPRARAGGRSASPQESREAFRLAEAPPDDVPPSPRAKKRPTAPAPARSGAKAPDPFRPLESAERDAFREAMRLAHEVMDTGLWYLGLPTDPDEPGGMAIWALEQEELDTVVSFYIMMAKRHPQMNAAARRVVQVMEYYEMGMVYASRVGLTVYAFMSYGINLRFAKPKFVRKYEQATRPAPQQEGLHVEPQ